MICLNFWKLLHKLPFIEVRAKWSQNQTIIKKIWKVHSLPRLFHLRYFNCTAQISSQQEPPFLLVSWLTGKLDEKLFVFSWKQKFIYLHSLFTGLYTVLLAKNSGSAFVMESGRKIELPTAEQETKLSNKQNCCSDCKQKLWLTFLPRVNSGTQKQTPERPLVRHSEMPRKDNRDHRPWLLPSELWRQKWT